MCSLIYCTQDYGLEVHSFLSILLLRIIWAISRIWLYRVVLLSMGVHVSVHSDTFNSFRKICRSRRTGSNGISSFYFLKTPHTEEYTTRIACGWHLKNWTITYQQWAQIHMPMARYELHSVHIHQSPKDWKAPGLFRGQSWRCLLKLKPLTELKVCTIPKRKFDNKIQ